MNEGGEFSTLSSWKQLIAAHNEIFATPSSCQTLEECIIFIIYEAIRVNICDGCIYEFIYLPLALTKEEKNSPIQCNQLKRLLELTRNKIMSSKLMKNVIVTTIIQDFLFRLDV